MTTNCYKSKDGYIGTWLYGYYVYNKLQDIHMIVQSNGEMYQVIPETLGQFTGLLDKNDKKIFEGDRVRYKYKDMQETSIETGIVTFNPKNGYYPMSLGSVCEDHYYNTYVSDIQVIGNIHEVKE